MRKLIVLSFVALAVGSGVATSSAQASPHFLYHKKGLTISEKVAYFERSTRHEESLVKWFSMVRQNLRSKRSLTASDSGGSLAEVNYDLRWHKAALRWHSALLRYYQPKLVAVEIPHLADWLCIHRYEGAWNDPNPPYYGGLQMDYGFMSTYGAALLREKGTADHWTPMEQMQVAEKAYKSGRGFGPWPNTARYCGLI